MTKIEKAQQIANKTQSEQIVIRSCYGTDILPASQVFPNGGIRSLSGCVWTSVKPQTK